MKVEFWGGGPPDGSGWACGINGDCADRRQKCNCDKDQGPWQNDVGSVMLKSVLPLTGIAVGNASPRDGRIEFTIGPLKCLF